MIGQFKSSHPLNIFWLVIITVLLRIPFALNLQQEASQPFLQLLQNLLIPHQYYSNLTFLGNITLTALLIFLQAFLFNLIVNKHNLLGKQTYLPALLYVVFCSLLVPFLTLSVPLVCNFFILYIFNKLLQIYKQPDAIAPLFDIGLVIGLATIIYYPLAFLLFFCWACVIVLRPFYWREWLSSLIAFTTIQFFLAVYYYNHQNLGVFINMWQLFKTPINFYDNLNLNQFWVLAPIAIVLLLALFKVGANFFKSFVLVRKGFIILLFMTFALIASFYLSQNFSINHFILLAIPVSFLMAYYFLYAKRKWIYETLFVAVLATIIYFEVATQLNFNF
ncbi:MAG: beta-carotene 15,15'-monooxygenase [Sphingobacteriales bacterium]|nr:MAG: beta-carotene 15,15'-monooxygenase [Sphingobacteriales bacterium]